MNIRNKNNNNNQSNQSIKTIYHRKLLLFVILGTLLSCLLTYAVLTLQAELRAYQAIEAKLRDVQEAIVDQSKDLKHLTQGINEYTLTKATAAALAIEANPKILNDQAKLDDICKRLDIDGLRVFDKNGASIAFAAVTELHAISFEYDDGRTKRHWALIADKKLSFVEEPKLIPATENAPPKYYFSASVSRIDEPGVIHIFYSSHSFYAQLAYDSVSSLASGFRFSANGIVTVSQSDVIVSSNNEALIGKSAASLYAAHGDISDGDQHFRVSINGVRFHGAHKTFLDYIIVGLLADEDVYALRPYVIALVVIGNAFVFFILYFVILFLLNGTIIKAIRQINGSLEEITSGNLDVVVDVNMSSEFKALSSGVNTMVLSLKNTIETTKHQMEKDLKLAALIQASALPRIFPPYPEKKQFEIFALMNPAKEVGGDFYDFFMLKDTFLVTVIADVSGKGIPGALFMMSCKTLIKQLVESGLSIDKALTRANQHFCENNKTGMFVTVWIGVLDINSGELRYTNAGHNPPLILRSNGDVVWLKSKPNLIVGSFSFAHYDVHNEMLHRGEKLFLYTDGVNECMNKDAQQYGNKRIEEFLAEHKYDDVTELPLRFVESLNAFANGAEQADDITMLALKFNGQQSVKQLTIAAKNENINAVLHFVNETLDAAVCGGKQKTAINIAVEEVCSNIAAYAYKDMTGDVTISLQIAAHPKTFIITFTDEGVPYNPLTRRDPDTQMPLEKRTIGGLGIYMVKKSMDKVFYRWENDKNMLTLEKIIEANIAEV